jgi:hypothetical protein
VYGVPKDTVGIGDALVLPHVLERGLDKERLDIDRIGTGSRPIPRRQT